MTLQELERQELFIAKRETWKLRRLREQKLHELNQLEAKLDEAYARLKTAQGVKP